jgi:hypothetical protein
MLWNIFSPFVILVPMIKKYLFYAYIALAGFQSWSCGLLQTIAVSSTTGIVSKGLDAVFEESDLQLAEQSIPSNLTLLEALHRSDPENEQLLLLLTQGYTGYTLGFVEDKDPERAKVLYRRARDFGLTVLKKNTVFLDNFEEDPASYKKAVESFSPKYVPIIFWTANAWGNLINVSIADPAEVADLHKVNALMDFVLRHDERFFYGSAHLYFGTILATTPKVLGGNPHLAKEHFDRCLEIGDNKFLLPLVYYAKSYAVQIQDQALFDSLLTRVDTASIDILPAQRLVNAIAKKKAAALREKMPDLF